MAFYTNLAEARAAAEEAGMSVLGVAGTESPAPQYHLVERGLDERQLRNRAFEILRGRPIDHREEILLDLVAARSQEAAVEATCAEA